MRLFILLCPHMFTLVQENSIKIPAIFPVCSHILKLFDGVERNLEYMMRLVYVHFKFQQYPLGLFGYEQVPRQLVVNSKYKNCERTSTRRTRTPISVTYERNLQVVRK